MPLPLSGKVALVTGGSRGIGAAIVRRLAKDGAAIAFTYASAKTKADDLVRATETAGGKALAIPADSADPAAIRAAVATTLKTLGRFDILVNNAGIGVFNSIADFPLEDFDRSVNINVRAVFVAAQEAAKHMADNGRIITIGSVNADRMPFAGGAVYAMTKAAVAGLTRGLARDLAPRNITVNVVAPGPIDTDLNPATGPFAESLKALMAMPRYGHPDDVASLVAYLAGPEAGFITAASLTVDGGFLA